MNGLTLLLIVGAAGAGITMLARKTSAALGTVRDYWALVGPAGDNRRASRVLAELLDIEITPAQLIYKTCGPSKVADSGQIRDERLMLTVPDNSPVVTRGAGVVTRLDTNRQLGYVLTVSSLTQRGAAEVFGGIDMLSVGLGQVVFGGDELGRSGPTLVWEQHESSLQNAIAPILGNLSTRVPPRPGDAVDDCEGAIADMLLLMR